MAARKTAPTEGRHAKQLTVPPLPKCGAVVCALEFVNCFPILLHEAKGISMQRLWQQTALVKLAMMKPAKWDGEFVTHFAPECPLFSKPKVMRVRRTTTAGQTGWVVTNLK
jgi:hypothetical protein